MLVMSVPFVVLINKEMISNIKYATDPILIVQGDDIDFPVRIRIYDEETETWSDYDLTGKALRWVIVNKHGKIIADWSTATGELTSLSNLLNVDAEAIESISCCASFEGQLKDLDENITIWKGIAKIEKGLI